MADERGLVSNDVASEYDVRSPQPTIGRVGPAQPRARAQFDLEYNAWGLRGRIKRGEFWVRVAAADAVLLAAFFALDIARRTLAGNLVGQVIGATLCLVSLVGLVFGYWTNLATQVKRLHDLNFSGWVLLLNLGLLPVVYVFAFVLPDSVARLSRGLVGAIPIILLGSLKGTQGANHHDVDPGHST